MKDFKLLTTHINILFISYSYLRSNVFFSQNFASILSGSTWFKHLSYFGQTHACIQYFQSKLSNRSNLALSKINRSIQCNLKFPSLSDVLEQGEALGMLQMHPDSTGAVLKLSFVGKDLQVELADQKAYLEQSEFISTSSY